MVTGMHIQVARPPQRVVHAQRHCCCRSVLLCSSRLKHAAIEEWLVSGTQFKSLSFPAIHDRGPAQLLGVSAGLWLSDVMLPCAVAGINNPDTPDTAAVAKSSYLRYRYELGTLVGEPLTPYAHLRPQCFFCGHY